MAKLQVGENAMVNGEDNGKMKRDNTVLDPNPGETDDTNMTTCGSYDYPLIVEVTAEVRYNDNSAMPAGAQRTATLNSSTKQWSASFKSLPDSPSGKPHRLIVKFLEAGNQLNTQLTVFFNVWAGHGHTSRCPS
jgi:hypothetical protein